ncbi:MAG: substrate-binding domain-containing protein [Ardenticatenaceae bacterium]|nr:substrate-binding domain-containing protein [Ardenticatenaceae bacterium]
MAEKQLKTTKTRLTVGLINSTVGDKYENTLLHGVMAGLRSVGVNLISFTGGGLHSYHGFGAQGNVVYDLATAQRVDAIIISGTLGHTASREELAEFVQQFAPLPVVAVALDLPGVPYLITDSYQGMYDAACHLITVHNRRRLAFLRGPKGQREADERLRAYQDALAQYGLPFREALVAQGDYTLPSGEKAMLALLAREEPFDAIVSANDTMALAATTILQQRGLRVPEDVAVVGFDDAEEARYSIPSLTTVRQRVFEQGVAAARHVVAMLHGQDVPVQTSVAVNLVLRRSCGCSQIGEATADLQTTLAIFPKELSQTWITQLVTALQAEQNGHPDSFLPVWTQILETASESEADVILWNQVLLAVQQLVPRPPADGALCQMWSQAQQQVMEIVGNRQARQRIVFERRSTLLRLAGDAMTLCRDLPELFDVIPRYLLQLGIRAFFLALYDDPNVPTGSARLILGFVRRQEGNEPRFNVERLPLPAAGQQFAALQLLPDEVWAQYGATELDNIIVEPLYAQENHLGFALFVADETETAVCDALRSLLSSALQNVLLHQKQHHAEHALARRVRELQTVAEVSIATATILDSQRLLQTVVNLTQQHFGVDHVLLVLLAADGETMYMSVAAGALSQQLIASGHTFAISQPKSLIAQAARERRGIIVNNVNQENAYLPSPLLVDTQAEMVIPLIVGEELLGVLDLQSNVVNRFTPDDLRVHQILGAQVAVALKNAQRYEQLEGSLARRTQELQVSIAVAQEIAAAPELTELFHRVVHLAQTRFGYYHAQVYALDEDILWLQAGTGAVGKQLTAMQHRIPLAAKQSVVARAARLGEPVLIVDTRQTTEWLPNPLLAKTRSELAVPIKLGTAVLGVLDVQSNIVSGLTTEDQLLLVGLCGQIAVAMDYQRSMTERQRTEKVLQESEARFSRVFHASPVAISLSSVENGRYLDVNDSLLRLLEYDRDQVIGRTVEDLNVWADLQDRKRIVALLQEYGAVQQVEIKFRTRTGRLGYAFSSMEIIELGGHPLILTMFHDITARKEAEEEREALIAELERKNTELERFTYTVSHDLKSPLVTIQGFLGFLEKDARAGNVQRLEQDIAQIRQATKTMQRLLQDLLELSRVGRLVNPPQTVSFAILVQDALKRVQGQITARAVQVEMWPDAATLADCMVYVDRLRLVEVLQNLFDNAVKFMSEQPEPRIVVGIEGQEEAGETVFFVRDNGMGIAPQYHSKVFDLFERLDLSVEGTGIGLALAKRIVEVHNGRIWVESAGAGQGTTFYFTLPDRPQ